MRILDGIYQLKVPIPKDALVPDSDLGNTLVYLVKEEDGWTLIDGGWNSKVSWDALQSELGEAGVGIKDISTLVVTHFHQDHMGLAKWIKEASGAKVVMHTEDAPAGLQKRLGGVKGNPLELTKKSMRKSGVPQADVDAFDFPPGGHRKLLPKVDVDHLLTGLEAAIPHSSRLKAMWTPGHTFGHVCVYDEKTKTLFSGDHVLPSITPNVSLFPMAEGNPLGDYLDSLGRLRNVDAKLVLPAHEGEFKDLKGRVDEIIQHHGGRLQEMMDAMKNGPRTAYQIAEKVKWNVGPWEKLATRTKHMAMFETEAHLVLLVRQGKVKATDRDGVVYYELARN